MADELQAAKARVKKRFLGQQGIHGVGIRRAEGAVCVYIDLDCEETAALRSLLTEIERDATPFRVLVIREEPPQVSK